MDSGGTASKSDNDDLRQAFQRANRRHKRFIVHHLGGRGFYAELGVVVRAMIYAEGNGCRLALDSSDFAYRFERGWSDYFEPFCEEYEPGMEAHVSEHCYSDIRGAGTVFRAVRLYRPKDFRLGDLGIGNARTAFESLFRAVFQLAPEARQAADRRVATLRLPRDYAAIHVRRGDKVGDEDIYYPADIYLDTLERAGYSGDTVFILSDDYGAVLEAQARLSSRRSGARLISLCEEQHQGFDIRSLRRGEMFFRRGKDAIAKSQDELRRYANDETVRLLAETLVATGATHFVGTRRSNVSKVMLRLHPRPENCSLITPNGLAEYIEASDRADTIK